MRHLWRLIPALLTALIVAGVGLTANPIGASASSCANPQTKYATGWDGVNWITIGLQLTVSRDFWGNCKYAYYESIGTGNQDLVWSQPMTLRVWVCGRLVYSKAINGTQMYYNIGPYTYGSCAPQADNYGSLAQTFSGAPYWVSDYVNY